MNEFENKLKLLNKKVLKFMEIKSIAESVSGKLSPVKIIDTLIEKEKLKVIELNLGVRKEKRFVIEKPDPFELALLLRSGSYFTHQTALYLNGLLVKKPKIIYVNSEQPAKPHYDGELEQDNIDNAFRAHQRQSKSLVKYNGKEIRLLNGMNTKQLGMIKTQKADGTTLYYTDLERTLIDITVRPGYSGGPNEVLNAYKGSSTRLSLPKLMEYLRTLDYKYPYHQAIGFYLEQTEKFSEVDLLPLKQLGLNYDFYLSHAMKKTKFNNKWRLYYPEDLPTTN